MNFTSKLATIFITMININIYCMEEIPNYSDQSIYLAPDMNFEEKYPDTAYGCQFFLNCSLNEYITTKLVTTVDANNKVIPYKYKEFVSAMTAIDDEIENAKVSYLTDVIKRNPPNFVRQNLVDQVIRKIIC